MWLSIFCCQKQLHFYKYVYFWFVYPNNMGFLTNTDTGCKPRRSALLLATNGCFQKLSFWSFYLVQNGARNSAKKSSICFRCFFLPWSHWNHLFLEFSFWWSKCPLLQLAEPQKHGFFYSGWWFQTFFIFRNIRDNPSHWLIFFKMVKTTNQYFFFVVVL